MNKLKALVKENTLIPGVRDLNDIVEAVKATSNIIFLLTGSILDLENIVRFVRKYGKKLIVNIDLVEGIAFDRKGIEYLAKKDLCDGIISTKNNLVRCAMKENLLTIQRVFLIDSGSLNSIKNLIDKNCEPDAFEILPAVAAPYFINNIKTSSMIIAGGLITKRSEAEELFKKGVRAISTSEKTLWN
ncbi:MAG TPA: glycerol-3-phosphate responsive antiterminator [Defluviitoga sp.]|nr:glycerol-3-phosphate responsive antiterminator [Defluviitoga sp.]HOP24544.1 glycerol-3-phosphate responsive antiterminator [Defluviitoga sp.]HPZ29507.1 glycerol-3-phosphate responsive antiterminator [Defluviitoga sp.]HQD62914.1 glycerol-3-phosphate responsive antiterminator [Defluviitoga sp.]